MLKRFKLDDVKPAKTPMPTKCQLDIDLNGKAVDQKVYHSMIGYLLYLCASRPDIMLSVGICARFQTSLRKATLWRSSESFDIWLIPQTLAYGTPKEQASTSWDIQTRIGRETMWIGSQLSEGANFFVAL